MLASMQAQTRLPTDPSSKVPGGAGEVTVVLPRQVGPAWPYCPSAELNGPSTMLSTALTIWVRSPESVVFQLLPQKMSSTAMPPAVVPPWDTTLVSVTPPLAGNWKPSAVFAPGATFGSATAGGTIPIRFILPLAGGFLSAVPRSTIFISGRAGIVCLARAAPTLLRALSFMVTFLISRNRGCCEPMVYIWRGATAARIDTRPRATRWIRPVKRNPHTLFPIPAVYAQGRSGDVCSNPNRCGTARLVHLFLECCSGRPYNPRAAALLRMKPSRLGRMRLRFLRKVRACRLRL